MRSAIKAKKPNLPLAHLELEMSQEQTCPFCHPQCCKRRRVKKMAYNRLDPQVHHWFIPRNVLQRRIDSISIMVLKTFAVFLCNIGVISGNPVCLMGNSSFESPRCVVWVSVFKGKCGYIRRIKDCLRECYLLDSV
jgi:hypothetical protein